MDSHRREEKIDIFAPKILHPRILKKKLVKRNTNSINKSQNSNVDSKIEKDGKNNEIHQSKNEIIDKNSINGKRNLNIR